MEIDKYLRTPITQKCKQCEREIGYDGICVYCCAENERNRILALSQEEIDAAIQQICDEIETTGDLDKEQELFTNLVNYRDIDTTKIAQTAFEKKVFWPCEIYKEAPADAIKSMIEILKRDDTEASTAGKLLVCLAIYGGEDVFQTFLELEKHPREWRQKLYVNPSFYAAEGGWSYDNDGRLIATNFNKCYPMVKETLEEKERSPVKIGVKLNEKCPHCDCQIVNIMEIDARDTRLDFLGINGVIKAKCCPNCVLFFDDGFCRYTINGESSIIYDKNHSGENVLENEEINKLAANSYILGDNPVPLRYTAHEFGGSSIGGFADWIQDCDIKLCPECGKLMQYLAQIQCDTVIEYMEGNLYIEICKDCSIMTILHQQT